MLKKITESIRSYLQLWEATRLMNKAMLAIGKSPEDAVKFQSDAMIFLASLPVSLQDKLILIDSSLFYSSKFLQFDAGYEDFDLREMSYEKWRNIYKPRAVNRMQRTREVNVPLPGTTKFVQATFTPGPGRIDDLNAYLEVIDIAMKTKEELIQDEHSNTFRH